MLLYLLACVFKYYFRCTPSWEISVNFMNPVPNKVSVFLSKQKIISQISCGWFYILWTLTLDCGPSRVYCLVKYIC